MMRTFLGILILYTLAGCNISLTSSRPPSGPRLQAFLAEKAISPLIVRKIGNESTVVLYRTSDDMGYYVLSDSDGNEEDIGYAWVSAEHWDKSQRPDRASVSVLTTLTTPGFKQVIGITINDPALAQNARTAKVIFLDGREVTEPVQNQAVLAISTARRVTIPASYQMILLYNEAGEEIYRLTPEK